MLASILPSDTPGAATHPSHPWPRIVRQPTRGKGFAQFTVCPPDGGVDVNGQPLTEDAIDAMDATAADNKHREDQAAATERFEEEEDEEDEDEEDDAAAGLVTVVRSKRQRGAVWRDARRRRWGDKLPPLDVLRLAAEAQEIEEADDDLGAEETEAVETETQAAQETDEKHAKTDYLEPEDPRKV